MKIAIVFDTPFAGYSHADHVAQQEYEFSEKEPEMEYQIAEALEVNGHEIRFVGIHDDINAGMTELGDFAPDLVFNCSESFNEVDHLDYLLPALLEAEGYIYTGSPPLGLMVTRNKGMSKKILGHHGVRVPEFRVYRRGEEIAEDAELPLPAIVKPLRLDASEGIALVSVVGDLDKLRERVTFIHEKLGSAAIVEQFVEGRELYVSLLGNGDDVEILPIAEMVFDKDVAPSERIATKLAKWDESYRKSRGIKNQSARRIGDDAKKAIEDACRIAYRVLWLRDYARIDIRLDKDGHPWVIEANANPYLNFGHELASSAKKAGMDYYALIERIVQTALARRAK